MATRQSNLMTQIMQVEVGLSQLLRRDSCSVTLYADGVNLCADVHYKGANIGDGCGLAVYEALHQAISGLYPMTTGELDSKFDEAIGDLNDEN